MRIFHLVNLTWSDPAPTAMLGIRRPTQLRWSPYAKHGSWRWVAPCQIYKVKYPHDISYADWFGHVCFDVAVDGHQQQHQSKHAQTNQRRRCHADISPCKSDMERPSANCHAWHKETNAAALVSLCQAWQLALGRSMSDLQGEISA